MNSQLAAPISEDRPLVSIIIPHRHQHSWLQRCLLMCCQQSYSNIEIIIVDDCSEDLPENHLNISDPRIRFIRTRSQIGPAGARNLGFKASTGQFIQFLDCDDHIHSKKIECQVQTLISNQGHVVLSNWRSAARLFGFDFLFPTSQLPDNEELLNETVGDSEKWFPIMCGLFSREFLAEVGPWNEGLEWNEDRDYRYRILKMKPLILRAPGNFFIYRRHNSPSRNTQFNVTPCH